MSQEYYRVLAGAMAAAGRDHAQLRMMVYQVARMELQKQLSQGKNYLSSADKLRQMSALETAIEQIESEMVGATKYLASSLNDAVIQEALVESTDGALVFQQNSRELTVPDSHTVEVLPRLVPASRSDEGDNWHLPASSVADTSVYPTRSDRQEHRAWWHVQLALAAILGLAIFDVAPTPSDLFSLLTRHGSDTSVKAMKEPQRDASVKAAKEPQPQPNSGRRSVGALIPNTYGVYAVSHGQLTRLGTLPIRIPDPRVAISALISKPSEATLPDGRLQFIVFRRDLVNNAPDRAVVRVVAQIMRALTFDAGKARTITVKGSWAVRSDAYEMEVAPVSGKPEMVTIRPEDPHFSFPAGRYALVIKDAAYDFTVAGSITDPAHCLERTEAVNAPVYNECRKP